MDITISLDKDQEEILKRAFPDHGDIQNVANQLVDFSATELIGLLAGEKRYLSLSHQYIEWIAEIFNRVIPDAEITNNYLVNNFQFPPGSAQYMSRVLRDRQNSKIHEVSIRSLLDVLKKTIDDFEALDPDSKKRKQDLSIRVSKRQFTIINQYIEEFYSKNDANIIPPKITSTTSQYYFITWNIRQVNSFYDLFEEVHK